MATIEGSLVTGEGRYAILVSRWNDLITSRLLEGSLDTLRRHAGSDFSLEKQVDIIWAPGSYEMPLVAQKLSQSGKYAAVIALACVIRGGTPHFDYVAAERSNLGAIQNRLTHTIDNLTNIVTNTEASQSKILDADYAKETTELTRTQIIQQAATAMLAQANQSAQIVLELLR